MKQLLIACTLTASFVLPFAADAQFQGNVYQEMGHVTLNAYGKQRKLAWCGGFDNPQIAMGDLNKDGKQDLVVFERSIRKVRTFINTGTAGAPVYNYAPQYALNFPPINDYLKLVDYNCDNIPDLIHKGLVGFRVFKGSYNSNDQLVFTLYKDLYYPGTNGWINAYVEPSDIPAVVDVDGDGDLDFLSYAITGAYITWYKNYREEDDLPCDSIRLRLKTNCWGKAYQAFQRTHTLGTTCFLPNPLPPDGAGKTTLHTGNTLLIFDHDGDGDMDYLNGNISFPDIQYMTNGKTQFGGRDSIVVQDTAYQTGGTKMFMPNWPSAFYEDMDQDGKKDLIFSPHAENSSENYKCISLYRNTGTAAAPVFTYTKDTLLIEDAIDAGSASYPVFYDYNKDGKPDLFVGSEGYYASGALRGKLQYYQNTSTPGNPSLELKEMNFNNVWAQNFHGVAPAFGDLNNDGVDDMVIGHADGSLSFYKNNAPFNTMTPDWQLTELIMKDQANTAINVQAYAAPAIYDMNKDGKKDLIIGMQSGYFAYYENTGSNNQLKLQLGNNQLGGMRVDPASFINYSTPFIGKMDNTGTDYILSGCANGMLQRFDGFQSGNVNLVYPMIDTIYSSIKVGYRSAPAIADIDQDGKYDLVVGNSLGGVYLFKQVLTVSQSVGSTGNGGSIDAQVFPNPAANKVTVSWKGLRVADELDIRIVTVTGQQALQLQTGGSAGSIDLDIHSLANGVYFADIRSGDRRKVVKLSVVR